MGIFGNYEEKGIITEITKKKDGFSIMMGSMGFFLKKENIGKAVPKMGDTLVLHTYAGSSIRGVDLNGKVLYYFSDDELEEQHRILKEKMKKENEERFKKEKSQMDADYEALPEYFQKRIDRFRTNNPDFRIEHESYELFCCKEAVKIANVYKTPEKVEELKAMNYEDILEIADIEDGHTYNTINGAMALAYHYLKDPANVEK